ncbi:alpha-amylase family glycosyl hydrolase [Streptococcus hillyeri]|uniref:Alpha-amylase n=1 Tax=Streptococcus hillyeri TaxID=2282420 RepID=A0A3L9DPK5_9STRE|nr:alpha-amylase family glycosyl hydrolase [Streptococcus hillyeri]RLY01863.1 alpha-amylase [Streptococcus hillyeri]
MKNTDINLRQAVIYSLYVRNFSEEGTFEAVIPELDRIKALGTDIIWFLPFYPNGEVARKGSAGSPYAIKDYRAVDDHFGTLEDFENLVAEIHARGMKVMIDIVYNHTSPDSILAQEHPEWFYHKPDGSFGNRVGDWSDIIDLDYANHDLWDYQIETLKLWVNRGVDGFRCDVAPLIPLAFWKEARYQVEQIKSDVIWLSESIEPGFIKYMRSQGLTALSDGEIFQAFDMAYDYDVRGLWVDYLEGKIPLSAYIDRLNLQEVIFPVDYIKLRNLENHDNRRAADLIPNKSDLLNWTVFNYLQKGAVLIYNGQERQALTIPSLFEKAPIDWSGEDISEELTRLAQIKKMISPQSEYQLVADDTNDVVLITHQTNEQTIVAIISLKGKETEVSVEVPDGAYEDLLNGQKVTIINGKITVSDKAIIFLVSIK